MALLSRGVLTDYDPDAGWFRVQAVDNPAVAGYTPHVERVYDLVNALQAEGPQDDDESGPYRDSGDEHKPHA